MYFLQNFKISINTADQHLLHLRECSEYYVKTELEAYFPATFYSVNVKSDMNIYTRLMCATCKRNEIQSTQIFCSHFNFLRKVKDHTTATESRYLMSFTSQFGKSNYVYTEWLINFAKTIDRAMQYA